MKGEVKGPPPIQATRALNIHQAVQEGGASELSQGEKENGERG